MILLSACIFHATEAKTDPDTGTIRLLHLGKVWLLPRHPGPIFRAEPRISWNPVPAYFTPDCVCHHATTYGEREVRQLRTKLPRTRTDLVSSYDVVLIDAMFALDMPPHLSKWIVEAVQEEGLGFMMVDDEVTFAGRGLAPSWYLTPIGDILPVDDQPGYYGWNEKFQLSPLIEDHQLVRGLDFEGVWLEANNRPTSRPGFVPLARGWSPIILRGSTPFRPAVQWPGYRVWAATAHGLHSRSEEGRDDKETTARDRPFDREP